MAASLLSNLIIPGATITPEAIEVITNFEKDACEGSDWEEGPYFLSDDDAEDCSDFDADGDEEEVEDAEPGPAEVSACASRPWNWKVVDSKASADAPAWLPELSKPDGGPLAQSTAVLRVPPGKPDPAAPNDMAAAAQVDSKQDTAAVDGQPDPAAAADKSADSAAAEKLNTGAGKPGTAAASAAAGSAATPLDCFSMFITNELLQIAGEQTNAYAKQKFERLRQKCPKQRLPEWKDTTPEEMRVFFIVMSALRQVLSRSFEAGDYWKLYSWLFDTPAFSEVMSRQRFHILLSCLHFVANSSSSSSSAKETPEAEAECEDPLDKVRPVMDIIVRQFNRCYSPRKEVVLDRHVLMNYGGMWMSRRRWELAHGTYYKVHIVAETYTGYVYSYLLNEGADPLPDSPLPNEPKRAQVVCQLVKDLVPGHVVYMDRTYTTPGLLRWMAEECRLAGVGQIRASHPDLPAGCAEKQKKGSPPRFWRDGRVLVCSSGDGRQLTVMSTSHGCTTTSVKKRSRTVVTPSCIADYKSFMADVEQGDEMPSYEGFPRAHQRWYILIFHHLLEVAVNNARIVYNKQAGVNRDPDRFKYLLLDAVFNTSKVFGESSSSSDCDSYSDSDFF